MDSLRHGFRNPLRDSITGLRFLVNERRDYLVGIGLLLIVIPLWTLASFAAQDVFQGGYEKPFLVAWLKISTFTLYLIPTGLRKLSEIHGRRRSGYERLADGPTPQNYTINDDFYPARREGQLSPLTAKETLQLASISCLLWFGNVWTIVASLDYTSVASATIMASMTGFFTLGIGRIFKVELLSITKVLVVVISFSGVVLVSLSDSTQTAAHGDAPVVPDTISEVRGFVRDDKYPNPLFGDFLALSGALFFAAYIILFKVRVRQESRVDMQLFFGFVGLCTMLFLWPIGLILHLTGVETFELPSDRRTIIGLLVNMFVTGLSDLLYVVAMLKTTPLVVTVGVSLTIPMAVAGDLLLGRTVKPMSLLGAFMVLGSFFVLGLENSKKGEVLAEGVVTEDQG